MSCPGKSSSRNQTWAGTWLLFQNALPLLHGGKIRRTRRKWQERQLSAVLKVTYSLPLKEKAQFQFIGNKPPRWHEHHSNTRCAGGSSPFASCWIPTGVPERKPCEVTACCYRQGNRSPDASRRLGAQPHRENPQTSGNFH